MCSSGGTLTIGGRALQVVANGDGPNLIVIVEHATDAAPPLAGAGSLSAAAGRPAALRDRRARPPGHSAARRAKRSVAGRERESRALPGTAEKRRRIPVRESGRAAGSHRRCRTGRRTRNRMASGVVRIVERRRFWAHRQRADSVVNAQVAVQAVRLVQTLGLNSAHSATMTVTAVDVAKPATPVIAPAIPFDPAGSCALLASRADWYGESRFTLSWTPQADCMFTLHRALADEVFRSRS